MHDFTVMYWGQTGSVWYRYWASALYEVHPQGEYFVAYKFHYNNYMRSVGVVVARYLANDIETAKQWVNTLCDIDTDPWDRTPDAKADQEAARQRLQELHELEKEQDRYRIYQ
jgi:hypothetical protein